MKILDFGLAKLIQPEVASSHETSAPTIPSHTALGMVLGTVGYMSPEQVRGQTVDHRSDIFSFGTILYEMLAGKRPFQSETSADVMSAILREEPEDLSKISPNIPPGLERIASHCLEKKPEERFQSARDMVFHLEGLTVSSGPSTALTTLPRGRSKWLRPSSFVGLGLIALILGYLLARYAGVASPTSPSVRVHRLTEFVGLEEFPTVSPDGRSVAFSADVNETRQIWARLIAGGPPLQITHDAADHQYPRWSPDSNSLIYYSSSAETGVQGTIWEISALGGAPRRVVGAIGAADISHDGKRLALLRVSSGQVELVVTARDGSSPRLITRLAPGFQCQFPRWSPDDKWIAYQQGRIFEFDVFLVSAEGGQPRPITHEGNLLNGFTWLPDGSGIVFSSARGGTVLYLPPFNLWEVSLKGGNPRQLTFGEVSYVNPDLNARGTLLATRVRRQFDIWKFPVDGNPRENVRRAVQITHQTGEVQTPAVSPDGKELVYLSDSGGHGNLWVMNLEGGELRQITFEQDPSVAVGVPVWSPDGKNIGFVSTRNLRNWDVGLWLVSPDGSYPRNIAERGGWAWWSADGRWLYYTVNRGGNYQIEKIPTEGGTATVVRTDNATSPLTAADGSALYYVVSLAGVDGVADYEIRVARPENGPSHFLARIPSARAPTEHPMVIPVLSPDGKFLAFQLRDAAGTNIWALSTSGGPMRQLTDFGKRRTFIPRRISWSADSRFIFAAVAEGDADVVLLDGLAQVRP